MFGKSMQNLSKIVTQAIKPMTTENKGQLSVLADVSKILAKATGDSGLDKATKQMTANLTKISKLIEAQTSLLAEIKPDDLAGDGGDNDEQVKELEEAVKRITDENKQQAAELDKLMAEIEKAAKEAGDDKDAGKKIKAATAALEKASKLIDEQSKLLEEAKKALAG